MATKKSINVTGLKVKYLPMTSKSPERIKVIQTNNNKSVILPYPDDVISNIDYIYSILDKIDVVLTYSLLVDNTQDDYYIIAVNTAGKSFPDLIQEIKDAK